MLVTGKCCTTEKPRQALIERVLSLPGILETIARGENKVSFKLRSGMQVDVRLLAPESFGAALCYFTGSKSHNIALRQRALKLGYTLSEYSLARLKDEKPVAGRTEEEIYGKLGLDFIPPEMRENCGEIELAEKHAIPALVTEKDLQGDVHMHTNTTDGRCTIEEMAAGGAPARLQVHGHHRSFEESGHGLWARRSARARAHQRRSAPTKVEGIKIFAGIEVDILADGALDLSDSVLEQMDLVIASVHSHFNQEPKQMTERLLRAIANPHVSILGHPTGRLLLRRDAYDFDMDAVLKSAAKHRVAMELNSYPDRLDLSDRTCAWPRSAE